MSKVLYLSRDKEFTNCIKRGSKINTNTLLVFYKKNSFKFSRIGISISKKVSKLSVIRNLIRRQIKSFFYTSKITLINGLDIVIVVKSNYDPDSYLLNLTGLKRKLNDKKLLKLT